MKRDDLTFPEFDDETPHDVSGKSMWELLPFGIFAVLGIVLMTFALLVRIVTELCK